MFFVILVACILLWDELKRKMFILFWDEYVLKKMTKFSVFVKFLMNESDKLLQILFKKKGR